MTADNQRDPQLLSRAELKAKTFTSILWTLLRVGWSTLSTFAIFVVLARVLTPSDFGIFALASIVFELGRILASAGLSDAVLREHRFDRELASTAFWANTALSMTFAVLMYSFAPLYESATHAPGVAEVVRYLCLLMPLAALGGIHSALIAKEFGHQRLAKQTMLVSTSAGLGAVLAAYCGFGVHSLLVQAALTNVLGTALAWHYSRWVPQWCFSLARLRQVTPFSAGMMANQLLWILVVRVQDLFISGMHGVGAVGQYRTAWRMIELIGQTVLAPIGSVSLVTLSTLQHDAPAFSSAYRRLLGGAALVGFPLLFGFGAVARELTPFVFGAKWSDTGQIAEVLIFIAVPFVLNYASGPALAALNKSGTILVLSAVTLGVTLVLTYFALPYGLIAVAMAYVLRTYVTAPIQQLVLCRRVGIAPPEILRTLSPPLLASLLMAGILWLSKPQLFMLAGGGLPFLCLAALLGGILYAAGLLCCGRRHLAPYFDLVRTLLRRFRT